MLGKCGTVHCVIDEAILYCQQEAYYNTVPEGSKESRAERITNGNKNIQRTDSDEEDDGSLPDDLPLGHQELHFPEISEAAAYLVALFHSCGMASATGMGLVGLSYQEIEAWARLSDNIGILLPWQYKALHTMSRAYSGMCAAAVKKDTKPPYTPEIEDIGVDEQVVSQQAEDIFEAMLNAQKR